MALTEAEELELLELERERAGIPEKPVEVEREYKPQSFAEALFPGTAKSTARGGNFLARTVAGAGDVLTLPVRAVSAGATGLGTLAGGGGLKQAAKEAGEDLGRTKSQEEGALGFIQNMALDPTSSPLLLGAGNIVKGGKLAAQGIKKGTGFAKALLKTGASGAATGAGSAAYQSATEGDIDPGSVAAQGGVGAMFGAAGAGLGKATGKALKGAAARNMATTLRPGQSGRKEGFDPEKVLEYGLAGKPEQVFEKSKGALKGLNEAQIKAVEASPERFNQQDIFLNALQKFTPQRSPENFAQQQQLIGELYDQYSKAFGDDIDAASALKVRQLLDENAKFIGKIGGGVAPDPNAKWQTDVYNDLRQAFKEQLHEKVPELQDINRMQHEIIPIEKTAERRIPIAGSKERMSLSDLLTGQMAMTAGMGALGGAGGAYYSGGDPMMTLAGAAAGLGARQALGSPKAAKAMYKVGDILDPGISRKKALEAVLNNGEPKKKFFQNRSGAVGSIEAPTLTNETAKAISDEIGVKFNGVQEGIPGKISDLYLFTDPVTKSTFAARTPIDVEARLSSMRNKFSEAGKKKFGNRAGAIGSADDYARLQSVKEGLTPALKDPTSGEVYSNPMGHKKTLNDIAKENPSAEQALWKELFNDNTGKYSDYVGFVDSEGNFISRQKAEELLTEKKKPDMFQQFRGGSGALPMLGITAGLSGGALAADALYRGNKKRKEALKRYDR